MSNHTPAFAGRTYQVRFDNGTVVRNSYAPDGATMSYQVVQGPNEGLTESVDLHVAQIGADLYYVNWIEASGTTVGHVMDLGNDTVRAFWTYPDDGAATAGRTGELHTARLSDA
ncbi:MoaF-related domain-containing protein [Streptomyces sp. NPDC093223]|uniref:MoaF-related domain-containing protein n=1 Tax=Streptomyces sp. NPDC093223 TaxID=3366033 RepID=UPI00382AB527